jgi:predicted lipid-binding transport protein (Tim44 family)
MGSLDIIIFAALAAILVARLWSVLGRRNDGEQQRPNPFATQTPPPRDEEDVMVVERSRTLPPPQITPWGHAAASLAGGLDQIRTLDPAFDEKQFLQGAQTAFTMIVEAFAKGDLAPVEKILAPPVRQRFQLVIDTRRAAGQTLESRIERIVEAEVTQARTEGNTAILGVSFVSHQINVTRDAQGQVVTGTPERAEEIHDLWFFSRDTKATDPNWQLIETRS